MSNIFFSFFLIKIKYFHLIFQYLIRIIKSDKTTQFSILWYLVELKIYLRKLKIHTYTWFYQISQNMIFLLHEKFLKF